jgi:hypothetical protein
MKPFWRGACLAAAVILGSASLLQSPVAQAAAAASSSQDRERFVSITKKLEAAPLDPKLEPDRDWAFKWLGETPDVQVSVCPAPLSKWDPQNYPYRSQIFYQFVFSMGTYLLENPAKAEDLKSQYVAGVEGALKAYQAILKEKPDAKSSGLDSLVESQSRGELPGLMVKAVIECSAKNGQPT